MITLNSLSIQRVSSQTTKDWMKNYHYTKGSHNGPSPNYGLFHNDKMVGALSFCTPVSERVRSQIFGKEHVNKVIELHRLHTVDDICKNASSWFASRCFDMLLEDKPDKRAIISFSDTTEGHEGATYKALNFYRCGTVPQGNTYMDQDGRLRSKRQCGVNITNAMALEKGWDIVKRKPKNRFILIIGKDKRERKKYTKLFKETYKGQINY